MTARVKMPNVKSTIQRWVEDQMEANELNKQELAIALDISNEQATRRLNGSSDFKAAELIKMARLFNKHWYYDIVRPFGVGKDEITLDQAEDLAKEEGKDWDLVDHIA
ncbi:MAG: helix-turn-helix domain-containing protein [Lewinella sp.]|jgi:hypothetical protein|uniref:helix-turn-helix domain-containing protein n=1 Tax=Lewinella sp. TaxID=2004506 RepID=UPI003D6A74B8